MSLEPAAYQVQFASAYYTAPAQGCSPVGFRMPPDALIYNTTTRRTSPTSAIMILLCTNFIHWVNVFNNILGIIFCAQNVHIYLLIPVMKHFKYHVQLLLT